jgi:hypothetical protein
MPILIELPIVFNASVTLSVVLGVGCCAVRFGSHFGQTHSPVFTSIHACFSLSQAKLRPLSDQMLVCGRANHVGRSEISLLSNGKRRPQHTPALEGISTDPSSRRSTPEWRHL